MSTGGKKNRWSIIELFPHFSCSSCALIQYFSWAFRVLLQQFLQHVSRAFPKLFRHIFLALILTHFAIRFLNNFRIFSALSRHLCKHIYGGFSVLFRHISKTFLAISPHFCGTSVCAFQTHSTSDFRAFPEILLNYCRTLPFSSWHFPYRVSNFDIRFSIKYVRARMVRNSSSTDRYLWIEDARISLNFSGR